MLFLIRRFYMITDIPNVVEKINENLPDQIRMWGNYLNFVNFRNHIIIFN